MSLDGIKSWVASLPSPVRHFIAVVLGTIIATAISAVVAHGGYFGVAWGSVLRDGFDKGVILAIATIGLLAVSPLTSSFGVGKGTVDVPVVPSENVPVPTV